MGRDVERPESSAYVGGTSSVFSEGRFSLQGIEEVESVMNKKMWRNFQLRADKFYSLRVAYRRFIIDKSKLLNKLNKIEKEV